MDEQARAVGQRVRYWRQRRGIDRQRFADIVGRSTSWVDKVEKGERSLLRLPMLERVAEVLNVAPEVLTDGPKARQTAGCVDAVEVQAIRSALGQYPSLSRLPGAKPPAIANVGRQLNYLGQAWISSNFTAVAQHLPALIHDAQVLAATVTGDEGVRSAAGAVAVRLGPEHRSHYTVFGSANVAAHRLAALVRLREFGRALEHVATIDPSVIAALPPERRANYLLDLTSAHTRAGNYQEATFSLTEAERLAPQEVQCRPLAHGLLRALLSNTSGALAGAVRTMALRAGVEA